MRASLAFCSAVKCLRVLVMEWSSCGWHINTSGWGFPFHETRNRNVTPMINGQVTNFNGCADEAISFVLHVGRINNAPCRE